ncbi:hypothetical protein WA171_006047 [Blastocystis sp. BT1]
MSESEDESVCSNPLSQSSETEAKKIDHTPVDIFTNIEEYLDCLGDKKMKSLSNSLEMVRICLMKYLQTNTIKGYLDMTCTNLNTIIRKERVVADVTAACRILVLLHATYCLDSPTVYEVSYSCLVDRAKSTKKQQVAVDCFHAAAVILFLTEVPDEVEDEFLEYVRSIIEKPNSTSFPLLAQALSAWVLLMSVKPKRQILTDSLPSFASKVDACLTVSDMSVRIAAAKCLAFINELLMVTPSYERVKPLDTIYDDIQNALSEYNRYWKESKDKDKKKALRDISRACGSDGHPYLELSFTGDGDMEVDLAINRWCGVVQYEMLSQSMGHGFSYHIVKSPLLQQVFSTYATIKHQKAVAMKENVVSHEKRFAILEQRNKRERELQAYEAMYGYFTTLKLYKTNMKR